MARPVLRPWSFGERVAVGPDYGYEDEQLDSEGAQGLLVEPDTAAYTEWAASYCQIYPYSPRRLSLYRVVTGPLRDGGGYLQQWHVDEVLL